MAFQNLCPPALIYLLFSITQIVIDTVKGFYNTALIKIWVTFIFTILLNYLCDLGLGIISWIIVFIPFILMTLIVSILLLMFGLDPATGKIKVINNDNKIDDKNKDNKIDDKNKDNKKHHKKVHKHHEKHHKHHNETSHHFHPSEQPTYNKYYHPETIDVYRYKIYPSSQEIMNREAEKQKKREEENKKAIQEREKKVLNRSILFYSESTDNYDKKSSKVETPKNEVYDTRKFKLFTDTISNILAGLGENQLSSKVLENTQKCINDINNTKIPLDALKVWEKCIQNMFYMIENRLNAHKSAKFKKQMIALNCNPLENERDCMRRTMDNMAKSFPVGDPNIIKK